MLQKQTALLLTPQEVTDFLHGSQLLAELKCSEKGRKGGGREGGIKYAELTIIDYFHHPPNNGMNYVTAAGPGKPHIDLLWSSRQS